MKWIIVLLLAGHPVRTIPEFFNTKIECEQAKAFADKYAPLDYTMHTGLKWVFTTECRIEDVI